MHPVDHRRSLRCERGTDPKTRPGRIVEGEGTQRQQPRDAGTLGVVITEVHGRLEQAAARLVVLCIEACSRLDNCQNLKPVLIIQHSDVSQERTNVRPAQQMASPASCIPGGHPTAWSKL